MFGVHHKGEALGFNIIINQKAQLDELLEDIDSMINITEKEDIQEYITSSCYI